MIQSPIYKRDSGSFIYTPLSRMKYSITLFSNSFDIVNRMVPPLAEEDRRRSELGSVCEWSVGPYVLTGGELPAMICIDAISRHIDGVLHNSESIEESRVSSHAMYGRPEVYAYKTLNDKGEKVTLEYKVPEVLLSGHHANIEKWKEGK